MSLKLLNALNRNNGGRFDRFIKEFKGNEPRICWYPGAKMDYTPLYYLSEEFSNAHNETANIQSPDLFLYTDFWSEKGLDYLIGENAGVYYDENAIVTIIIVDELPILNLEYENNTGIYYGDLIDRVFLLRVTVESNQHGPIRKNVIYAFTENATFFCNKLRPNQAEINSIIRTNYRGGNSRGEWLNFVLRELNTDILITDELVSNRPGKLETIKSCSIMPENEAILTPIEGLQQIQWGIHGPAGWYRVS